MNILIFFVEFFEKMVILNKKIKTLVKYGNFESKKLKLWSNMEISTKFGQNI